MNQLKNAFILAGGKSTRMDFDKQTILIHGKMMPLYIADHLASLFSRRIILTNLPELYPEDQEIPLLPDRVPDLGPKGGILTGLSSITEPYAFFIGCDMPFVNLPFICYMETLLDKSLGEDSGPAPRPKVILARKDGYLEPLNAFYSKELLPEITAQLQAGNNKISSLYQEEEIIIIEEEEWRLFDPQGLMFFNLNSAADYEKLYEITCHYSDFHPPFRLQK